MYDFTSIYRASSAEDAISALARDSGAIVIAGGTDVLIKIREGELAGCRLVSIHGIRELEGVTLTEGGDLRIGALTTFHGVAANELVRRCIPYLG